MFFGRKNTKNMFILFEQDVKQDALDSCNIFTKNISQSMNKNYVVTLFNLFDYFDWTH